MDVIYYDGEYYFSKEELDAELERRYRKYEEEADCDYDPFRDR